MINDLLMLLASDANAVKRDCAICRPFSMRLHRQLGAVMKKALMALALTLIPLGIAWAECEYIWIMTPDGRQIACMHCCDDKGQNCTNICG